MVSAIIQLVATTLAMNAVGVTPQEWVRGYTARGGTAEYSEKNDVLYIALFGGVAPWGVLYPKGVAQIALVGVGVRNSHVSAVLKWPGVEILYMPECTGINDTVFPIIKASRLREIHMHDIQVTAAGVSRLSGSKTIRLINIATSDVKSAAGLKLSDMAQLELLSLLNFNMTSVVLSDMPVLRGMFPTSALNDPKLLRRVEFSNLPQLPDVNFALAPLDKLIVNKCKSLEEIWVEKGKLSDDDISALTRNNPKLKIIRK